MATFSKTGFKTLNYNSFRPRYPPSFYQLLAKYATGSDSPKPIQRTLDIGCGTGIATYDLLNISENVVGLDLSPSMVQTCNDLKAQRCEELGIKDQSRVSFVEGDIDSLPTNEKFDLITAAQCLHWSSDFPKFFKRIHEILKPGGTLAYWYYVDPIFVNDSPEALQKAKKIYFKYAYDDPNLMGPHWEQPGRNVIKNCYVDVNKHIPKEAFTDVTIDSYYPSVDAYVPPSDDKNLVLVKPGVGIKAMEKYFSTYSGYHNLLAVNKDSTFIDDYAKELKEATGWTDDTKLDMVWNTGYTFLKKA
ncbi:S-adenosylmethionine-dependent methyltransferase [Yamadazyma tenuis]|uniref:S-adenosyl-L-methionine-dependent methyltransferase n=1 Tax=Candida tenuis (strain ATCC 10573 / BCRC 21748 / CBS 615 / JCM 9827 / NBRC 10315 / NRRL Y-1498 / VKM Y-70) TaxID=590646 RepID=G3AW77_CANTC|nr:S-adenosyl-L-methionine-dependent methyltransferase [Yamadazyma tenuis ATCC 10573]EGV66473.1 S-adenosyl-L-methionine-dependent methyltransferase [Yamadazyma tenuis ATCC 10573]WEJ95411.1 S-adenosylmethionine-dependent methyltransferase [Yamadazyma tenuis]